MVRMLKSVKYLMGMFAGSRGILFPKITITATIRDTNRNKSPMNTPFHFIPVLGGVAGFVLSSIFLRGEGEYFNLPPQPQFW
jgi:hypothetical protein